MSLINEALKRTRDASFSSGAAPVAAPSYRVHSGVESSGSKGTLLVTALIAAVAVGSIVGLTTRITRRVASLKNSFDPSAETAAPTVSPPKQPESRPIPAPAPPPVTPTEVETSPAESTPAASAVDSKTGEDQLVARVVEKIKADQAANPPTPEPPKYVLQGVTLAKDGNEAMINGLSVREGEDIEGARVVAIDRRTVKLDCGGHEIVLHMP